MATLSVETELAPGKRQYVVVKLGAERQCQTCGKTKPIREMARGLGNRMSNDECADCREKRFAARERAKTSSRRARQGHRGREGHRKPPPLILVEDPTPKRVRELLAELRAAGEPFDVAFAMVDLQVGSSWSSAWRTAFEETEAAWRAAYLDDGPAIQLGTFEESDRRAEVGVIA